jgi:hypothetical protein
VTDFVTKFLAKDLGSLENLSLVCNCEVPTSDASPLPKLKYLKLAFRAELDPQYVRRWFLAIEGQDIIDLRDVHLSSGHHYSELETVFEAIRDHPNAIDLEFDQIVSNDWAEFSCSIRVPPGRKLKSEDENGDDKDNGDDDEDKDKVDDEDDDEDDNNDEEGGVDSEEMLDVLHRDFEKFMAGEMEWTLNRALQWFFD